MKFSGVIVMFNELFYDGGSFLLAGIFRLNGSYKFVIYKWTMSPEKYRLNLFITKFSILTL